MNRRLGILFLFCIISIFLSRATPADTVAADKTPADKPAKEESAAPAANNKPAKDESPAAATTDKQAKPEPAAAKPAKEEPATPPPSPAAKPSKEEPAAAPAPAVPPAPTYTVKRDAFKIQFELDGMFETRNMTEIILNPKEWSSFTVNNAIEHGARVKKGDVLIEFDAEKIDKTVEDLRAEKVIAELSLKQAEDLLAVLEKITPLDLEASQRAQRQAEEDQKRYFDDARPMLVKTVDNFLKFNRQELDYAREELEQLEKMYKSDDLTEETEKIVLKRTRNNVERTEFYVERAEHEHDQMMKFQIPRTDEQIKEAAVRKTLAWTKDKVQLPLTLERQRLDVARQKVQLARLKERLNDLVADQELMKIKAPTDGYVYFGRCQRGKFSEIPVMVETLRHGGSVSPHRVLLTIIDPRPIFVHSTFSEERLQYIRRSMDCTVAPVGYPDIKLDAVVDDFSKAPISMGSYDLQISLALEEQPPKTILPGMACKIKLIPYSKSDALVVPPRLVSTDPLDDEKHFVYLQTKDGKSEKHDVTIGKQNDKQMEILKGLSEGDKILLEPPKDAK